MLGIRRNKRGQQEMVGFVLIVVLVVVGMMVFLVISLRGGSGNEGGSLEVSNILNAVTRQTTECAIVYEPDYDNFEDLFKSCHQGDSCSNLRKSACEYLNESLSDVLSDIMLSEASVDGYLFEVFVRDGVGIVMASEGECLGASNSAQRSISSNGDKLIIRMKVCSIVD
jgi:hypothetical protein